MKKLKELGRALNKAEQQKIHGGGKRGCCNPANDCCSPTPSGNCQYSYAEPLPFYPYYTPCI